MSHSLYNACITGSQPLTKGAHFKNTPRDTVPASSTDRTSFSMSSTSHGLESLIRRSDTKEDASKLYASSGASVFGNSRRISCSEQVDDVQFISDLGETPVSNRSVSSPPKFTAESATDILLNFGLEKEDLVDLAAYPEDEITPDTLPLILRQIYIQKQKRAAGNSSEHHPATSTGLKNSSDSEVAVKNQDMMPKNILKPSKVIDYGHSDKSIIVKDKTGRTSRDCDVSGATLPPDNQKPSGQSRKLLQEGVRASESVTSLSSKKKSVHHHPDRDPTKQPLKQKNTKPLKSKASKPFPLKEPEPGCLSTLKTKDFCPEHLSHPGFPSSSSKQRKTQERRKTFVEERKHQQMNQNYVQQKTKILGKRETKQLNKPESKMVKLSPQTASSHQSVVSKEPLLPTPIRTTIHRRPFVPSSPVKGTLSKDLPTPSMVNDYSATTPRVFPHTCCLCNKECAQMQDWLSHQNTSFHIESCRLLRKQYPRWDGEIQSVLSSQHRTTESSPSTYQTSHHRHQSTVHESCSRTRHLHHYQDLESGRDISKSSSHSSHWRRHSSSSYSCSHNQGCRRGLQDEWHRSRSRSHSTSPRHHRGAMDRRDRRRSRSGSPHSFRDTHRYDQSTSHYLSHSRSNERPSSFNRRDEGWSSPRRSFERELSPERSDEKQTSPRWSHERRLSTEKPVPQRRKSSSTERLTKKLLETSALQSLSNQSDFETVVKTLTPVLLAEIDKMKLTTSLYSSLSSSSPSYTQDESESESLKTEGKVDSSAKLKTTVPKKPRVTPSVKRKKSVKKLGLVHKDRDKVVCLKKTKILKKTLKKKMNTKQKSACKRLVVTASDSSDPLCFLTVGEQMEKYLDSKDLWPVESLLSQPSTKNLLITNLPEFHDGCYTEGDIADLLSPFGFKHDNDIYVIPQKRMAVALMPSIGELEAAISASLDGIIFRGSKLSLQALKRSSDMTPFAFYCGLMQRMRSEVTDEASVVYITNISASETRDLREALRKISSVRNFLPLLNKVFIEFDSVRDADRIGVWYSLLKQGRTHKIKRMKLPEGLVMALSPRMAVKALPGIRDITVGSKIPRANHGVPQGSFPAFWVTMTTCPYMFPTASPWFNIPDFLTVKEFGDIEKADPLGSAFSTIMLTGFRGTQWQYEEIAGLLWRYFPQNDLDSLFFNVVVLPLQRRVFVYFTSWDSCCSFVRDHLMNPIKAQGFPLSVHFVLEEPHQGCSEEVMYKNLMEWTNAHVSEPESLTERLLCVEVSVININLVIFVMKVVASLASFVNFLPLANRIYIEMAESSGVNRVVNNHLKRRLSKNKLWKKVQNVRPLMSIQKTCSKNSNSSVSDPELESTAGGAVAETTKTPDMDQPAGNTETRSGGPEQGQKLQEEKEAHKEQSRGMDASFLLPDYFEILDSFDNQTETEGCSKISEIPSEEFSKSDHGPIQEKVNTDQVTDSVNKLEELEPEEVEGLADDGEATQADESTTRSRTSNTKEEKSPNKQDKMWEKSEPREKDSNTGDNKKDLEEESDHKVQAEEDACCSTAVEVMDEESFQQLAEESGPGEGESKTQFNENETPAENSNSDTTTKVKENNDSSKSKEIISTQNKTEGDELDKRDAADCKCDDSTGKRRKGLCGPTAKRIRQFSPVASDSRLQPYDPNSSYGKEFVVPKMGYFCLLCSVFYACEDTEEDRHCSSKTHYDNVQKHYQKTAEQVKPS